MKIEYSKDIDVLYVYFREKRVAKSREIEDGVVVDLGEDGHIVGIEILEVSKRMEQQDLSRLNVEHFPVEV